MEKDYILKKESSYKKDDICLEPLDILKEYYSLDKRNIDGGFFDNGPWPWENWTDFNNNYTCNSSET